MTGNLVSLPQSSPTRDLLTDSIEIGAREPLTRTVEVEPDGVISKLRHQRG